MTGKISENVWLMADEVQMKPVKVTFPLNLLFSVKLEWVKPRYFKGGFIFYTMLSTVHVGVGVPCGRRFWQSTFFVFVTKKGGGGVRTS